MPPYVDCSRALLLAVCLIPATVFTAAPSRAASLPAFDDVAQVAAGQDHSCALSRQGTVSCWGSNEYGQLGVGDASPLTVRTTPVPVIGLRPGVRAIAAGGAHTCAITAARGVQCWGWNVYGALGDGTDQGGASPVDVQGLGGPVAALTGGAVHSCALLENGSVQCWGANGAGQLGDGSLTDRFTPVTVSGVANAVLVEAGGEHTCAALADGGVRCWGENDGGQLGDGSTTSSALPVVVADLPGGAVRALAAAARGTCAVTAAGALHCWGPEYPFGAFIGGATRARPYPGFESGFTGVDAGNFHFCALAGNGVIKCLGDNTHGQHGTGPIDGSLGVDTAVGLAPAIQQVVAGGDHTCARSAAGGLQCWGRNTRGALGLDSISRRLVPTQVVGLETGMASVAAGSFHSCSLSLAGAVKCWGANNQDQIGDGTRLLRLTPVDVTGLQSGVRALAAGTDSSCVVTAQRRVKCWGANFDGRLGNGTTLNSGTPVDVVGLGEVDVLAVSVGHAHGCALLQGGAVKCWGDNAEGQVGDGSTAARLTAVDVAGLGSGVRAISAGYYHSCAITAAGGLKCWGANGAGQLGDGSTLPRPTPVDVVGLAGGVVAVGTGEQHSCAVLQDGAVKCWGFSFFGAVLGDGSTLDRAVPGDVPALRSGVVDITLGGYRTCVRFAGGAAQCWGSQPVGDNTELTRPMPVDVPGLGDGVTSIDIGFGGQNCAVADGAARCWGENTFAQVGDGSTHGVPTPQVVVTNERARDVDAVTPAANDAATAAVSDASGRFVVFQSRANNLVPGDLNGSSDIFRADRQSGVTVQVSVDDAEAQIAGDSIEPSVSQDGLYIVFVAADAAVSALAGERAKQSQARRKSNHHAVLLRNLVTGSTQRLGTALPGGTGTRPQIAPRAVAVVFTAAAANGLPNVFHLPLTASGAQLVPGVARCLSCKSVAADGTDTATDSAGASRNAVLSADGRQVAWQTVAKNSLAASPSPCPGPSAEIVLRNLVTGAVQRMSPPATTSPTACGSVGSTAPSLDYTGGMLAFQTDQPLADSDRNTSADVYAVAVTATAAPLHVSAAAQGAQANGESVAPRISGDGRTVTFVSDAKNLDLSYADNNDRADVHAASIDGVPSPVRLSRTTTGGETDAAGERPVLNFDGTKVAFDTAAAALRIGGAASQALVYQRSNPAVTPPRSATWWKSSESGWGLTVFDQGSVLAPTWFTYDSDGEPTWFIVGGAFPQTDGSYRGELLRFTGTRYDQIQGSAALTATPAGNVVLRYNDADTLAFEYTVAGTTQSKTLARFPFGARNFACTASPAGDRSRSSNYTDLWTGAESANAGWGLTLFHIDDGVFAIWYTYDLDGEATFFVISASRQADDSYAGTIFRQRNGTPFLQIAEQPASPAADAVGTAVLRFSDGDSASFSYILGDVSQTKPIARLVVGSRPTECQAEPAGG